MRNTPTNADDMIDSRDVIARIEELEGARDDLASELEDRYENNTDLSAMLAKVKEWDTDNGEELTALKALQDQAEGYSDWMHGAQLIRDSYFKDYAMQYADDVGAMKDGNAHAWPFTCIDWDAAADELQSDYTSVEFDGVTYWVR